RPARRAGRAPAPTPGGLPRRIQALPRRPPPPFARQAVTRRLLCLSSAHGFHRRRLSRRAQPRGGGRGPTEAYAAYAAGKGRRRQRSGWALIGSLLGVEAAAKKAQQPLRQENDHDDEDDPDGNQVVLGNERREALAGEREEG